MLDQIWNPDPQSPLSIHGSETEMYLIHNAEILMLNLRGLSAHGNLPWEGARGPPRNFEVGLTWISRFWFKLLKNCLGFAQKRVVG